MTDEHKQRLQEEQEDEALKLLMEEYAEIEGEALWREFLAAEAAGNDPDSPHKENRDPGRGSEEKNRQNDFLMRYGNGLRRAAVISLVLVCLLSPLVMTVEAFKIPVINYFVALEKKFSAFNFGKNTGWSQEQEAIMELISSVPCPEECYISHQEVTSKGKLRTDIMHSEKVVMSVLVYPPEGQINIDTEDVAQIPMKIHDYEAVYLHKEGHRLMWIDEERALIINIYATELEESNFWRYAYSLAAKMSQ